MNRNIAKLCPVTWGFLGFDMKHQTADDISADSQVFQDAKRAKDEMDPWERVKVMYTIE